MKHLFVPYEIALKLKEKGFNEPCFGYYNETLAKPTELLFPQYAGELDNWNYNIHLCSALLYQQVIDWFREKHNIHLAVDFEYLTNKYDVLFQEKTKGKWERYTRYYATKTYNESLNKAIEEAIKLI